MWTRFKWNLHRNHCLVSRQAALLVPGKKYTKPWQIWLATDPWDRNEQWKGEVPGAGAGVLLRQTWWNHTHFLLVIGEISAKRDWGTCDWQEWGFGGAVPIRSVSERESWVWGGVIRYKVAKGLIQGSLRQLFLCSGRLLAAAACS